MTDQPAYDATLLDPVDQIKFKRLLEQAEPRPAPPTPPKPEQKPLPFTRGAATVITNAQVKRIHDAVRGRTTDDRVAFADGSVASTLRVTVWPEQAYNFFDIDRGLLDAPIHHSAVRAWLADTITDYGVTVLAIEADVLLMSLRARGLKDRDNPEGTEVIRAALADVAKSTGAAVVMVAPTQPGAPGSGIGYVNQGPSLPADLAELPTPSPAPEPTEAPEQTTAEPGPWLQEGVVV